GDVALHERYVLVRVDDGTVGDRPEIAVTSGQRSIGQPLHQPVLADAVSDQVRDRDDPDVVLPGVDLQVWKPGHGPVVLHDLADDPGRNQPGQPAEIDNRLGLAGPHQDAAVTGLEREHVPRHHD